MMQRKRHIANGGGSHSVGSDVNDDGGSAKIKPSHNNMVFAFGGPSSTKLSYSKKSSTAYCLPGVPVVLKMIIISFVGFAMVVVLTAKGRHAHWRYKNALRAPHMPKPLMDMLHAQMESNNSNNNVGDTGKKAIAHHESIDNTEPSLDATQRMAAQPSKFVDSEKKLKNQLLQLLEKQKAQQKHKPSNPNDIILGVKISTRYLGEDVLPYPESRGDEKEWEKKMEQRKKELGRIDVADWKDMIQQYNDVMENIMHDQDGDNSDHEEDNADHKEEPISDGDISSDADADSQQQIIGDTSGDKDVMRPPKGTERWPSPSGKAGVDTTILLKPAFGSHRPASDAILVFAEGYDLSIYLALVESLISTGYSGDLVLSISNEGKLKPGVKDYLQSKNSISGGVNIVAYMVNWSCFKQSGEVASGSNEGINHCKMDNAFGDASGNPISDPRDPRPVATARYEIYWMWSLHYNKESWLMLIDARDVWFQLQPFEELTNQGKVSGELHLFGENAEVVQIGTSSFNRKWLTQAYGKDKVSPFFENPVICSGSTIGNQDAIETYLRAMVAEYDTTLCKSKGCDQGFHNYLYYSGKLNTDSGDVEGISKVIVHEQGKGIINNLGALRTKPLQEWGMYDAEKQLVLNWDGSTSPVAHQYDRDKEVNIMVKAKKRQFDQLWKSSNK